MPYWEAGPQGIRLQCHIQPKASRDAIAGVHNERLKIHITAPPTDGKANAHLQKFLAKALGIPRTRIRLISGQSSRQKSLLLEGLERLPEDFPRDANDGSEIIDNTTPNQ
jgi:TIGR00251 family protein